MDCYGHIGSERFRIVYKEYCLLKRTMRPVKYLEELIKCRIISAGAPAGGAATIFPTQ
jgi:hypothetical protein